jgi:hypothetical protein
MANADIHPPSAFLATQDSFKGVLLNEKLAARFDAFEAKSVAAKTWYTRLGVFSLAAAFITMASLISALTIAPGLKHSHFFTVALGMIGALGLAAQIGLLASPLKHRWLVSRFAAERLRGLKFQAFAFTAATAREDEALRFTDVALGKLEVELDKAGAAMREFEPEREVAEPPAPNGALTALQLAALKDVYRTLRLDYQINHARHCISEIQEARKLPAAASEISFWLAVLLGYVDLVLAWLGNENGAAWREFFTLFFFVLSAILFVLERGLSFNAALERYEEYAKRLGKTSAALDRAQDPSAFIACVREGEETAYRELQAFCREAEKSTYLF